MKKGLFLHLSVLAILIAFISSCSKTTEYTNAIPADATSVVALNLKSLGEKAGIGDKENKEALQKLTDVLKNEMNAATFQQLETVLKDPNKAGIDLKSPVYLFNTPNMKAALVAKVSNEDDLENLLQVTEKEQISSAVAEGDGYRYATLSNQAILAFTPSALVMVSYSGEAQLENAKGQVSNLLKQTAEQSIANSEGFKKAMKKNGEINVFIALNELSNSYAQMMKQRLPNSENWEEMFLLGSLSFEKGEINFEAEWYTNNDELRKKPEQQAKATTRPIQNNLLKYFPQSSLALFSMGINGEEVFKYLQENEDFQKSISMKQFNDLKVFFDAFQNDITIGLINVTMQNAPAFLAYAEAKNNDMLKALYEKKNELGLQRGADIIRLNENEYVYKSRKLNVFFGIKDKTFYATNDELLYKSIGKASDPSAAKAEYASEIKGKNMAFIINIESICSLPVVKMLAQFGGQQAASALSLCDNLTYLEVTGDIQKANFSLKMKNKEVNSLKQIVNFARQFAGM